MVPMKSIQMRFPHNNTKVDVSLWEGRAFEGKPMPSSLSLRLLDLPDSAKPVAYLSIEEALNLANILQNYAFHAVEHDTKRRLEAWKMRAKEKEE